MIEIGPELKELLTLVVYAAIILAGMYFVFK